MYCYWILYNLWGCCVGENLRGTCVHLDWLRLFWNKWSWIRFRLYLWFWRFNCFDVCNIRCYESRLCCSIDYWLNSWITLLILLKWLYLSYWLNSTISCSSYGSNLCSRNIYHFRRILYRSSWYWVLLFSRLISENSWSVRVWITSLYWLVNSLKN